MSGWRTIGLSSSNARLAAAICVISALSSERARRPTRIRVSDTNPRVTSKRVDRRTHWLSYAGATSTTSAPTMRRPRRPCRTLFSSRVVQPPISGVPVAGANAGSRTSMSSVMYLENGRGTAAGGQCRLRVGRGRSETKRGAHTGLSPTRSRIRSTTPWKPMSSISSATTVVKPTLLFAS